MSVAFRSIAPFMRTARQGLTANPLRSIKTQNAASILNAYRTYATHDRSKPHVNIGEHLIACFASLYR